MSRRKAKSFVPQLTALENREVPAIASTRLFGGVVTAVCDNAPSTVLVYQNASNVTVRDVITNRAWTFSASQVGRVDVYGGAGADTITSKGPANAKVVRVFGLAGNDTLIGGNGREVLTGNTGTDTLKGGGANDTLNGGIGNDLLVGGDGDDTLNGGDGDNRMIGGAGADTFNGGAGRDTIISIDGDITDTIAQGDGSDFIWRDLVGGSTDSADTQIGDFFQDVDGFDNTGADTTLNGDEIPLPTPLPGDVYERFNNRPLFGNNGPNVFDINQGALGDCYFLTGLGSAAMVNPDAILSRAVDFGDGTFGVSLGDKFYRVDNRLVVARYGDQQLNYVSFGDNGSIWPSVMEKAFTYFRQGDGNYDSIQGGFCFDVFNTVFEATDAQQVWFNMAPGDSSKASLTAVVREMMDGGYAPTLGIQATVPGLPLVTLHQYIVLDYTLDVFGELQTLTLYNPWGIDGVPPFSGDPNDGIVTITGDELAFGVAGSLEFAHV
jgi:calpain family cysteine protease/hemolysin type calcium-binding protein